MSGHAGTITCVSSRAPFARFQANSMALMGKHAKLFDEGALRVWKRPRLYVYIYIYKQIFIYIYTRMYIYIYMWARCICSTTPPGLGPEILCSVAAKPNLTAPSWLKVSHAEMDEAEAQLSQARPSWLSLMFQSVYDENAFLTMNMRSSRPTLDRGWRLSRFELSSPLTSPGPKVTSPRCQAGSDHSVFYTPWKW